MAHPPTGRSSRERDAFAGICYPGTETLVNLFDIQDAKKLSRQEHIFTRRRIAQGLPPEAQALTYDGFKAIHRHLFQDVYAWAGQERRYTTGRGAAPFAVPEQIAPWMEQQMTSLKRAHYLRGLDQAGFCEGAAILVNEVNAAHAFIEGNGRVQRIWLRQLAEQAGYRLTFSKQDRTAWYDASRIGFEQRDHAPMQRLLQASLTLRM